MNNYLPTDYQSFIHTSRYARWLDEEGRRETWGETVGRYVSNIVAPVIADTAVQNEISEAITGLEVMPSMRSMMTAGVAAARDNTCMYNCSYLVIDDMKAFDEAMFILLCGTGVGFSCERQYIKNLPEVPEKLFDSETTIVVKDSKEGWAKAYRLLISMLFAGEIPTWDVSKVRPAGARLKTFGGRASGPAPLVDLFNFTIDTFKKAAGSKLSSYDCHSIMCKIGEVVVVGGVRRSAMISLSNLSDDRMRHAKSGKWWETAPHMGLANNSVAYTEKPDAMSFLREWTALAESGSGERGIFNREAAVKQAQKNGRRDPSYEWGTNPCSEIILRGPKTDKNGNPIAGTGGQFCNLSEVVIRATDTKKDLIRKVRIATILGTIQSTYTKFPYLRKVWAKNTAEERLLGVSLTGIMDNTLTNGKEGDLAALLEDLKQVAVDTNKEWADKAHEGYVLIKDQEWSKKLAKFSSFLPELQKGIPVDEAYKKETPGTDSDLNAYDVVFYAGDCNSGSKTIAINLPNDEEVQLQKGTRRLQLKNAMRAKFDKILVPISEVLIEESQRQHITFDAFFANTMFHEVAHGLGIKNTINGKGLVRKSLKEHASALEEGKADVLGLYMVQQLHKKGEIDGDMKDYMTTFMASIFRSVRFGASSAHGKANMIRFNFFKEKGAFSRNEDGTYKVNYDNMIVAMKDLSNLILTLQGNGDYDGVAKLVAESGVISEELQADLDRLSSANIPVDVVFEQGVVALGL